MSLSVAQRFAVALTAAMSQLDSNEWAVTQAREDSVVEATSFEAFESIVPVLDLASKQEDPYAFVSCIWFALDLARKSETTQVPIGLVEAIQSLESMAVEHDAQNELYKIAQWYRLRA